MDQRPALDWIPGLGEEVDSSYQENTHEIKVLAHIADQMNTNIFSQGWKSAQQRDISLQWHREWQDYINALSESHIRIKEGPDKLVWSLAENGIYTPKVEYLNLISHKQPEQKYGGRVYGSLYRPQEQDCSFGVSSEIKSLQENHYHTAPSMALTGASCARILLNRQCTYSFNVIL